jgi:hypothetical protein
MTIKEFQEWCEYEGVADDALLVLYDAEGFETRHVEEDALEVVSDGDEEPDIVQVNIAMLAEGDGP